MTSALEEIKQIDIEEWLTLATAPSPTKLKQGQTPDMQNVWTDEKPGSIITAPGFIKVGTIPSNLPVTFCINYFKTSGGTQTFVVSDNSTVWTTVDFQNFTSIITGLSGAFQLRGLVVRDKLWLTNGSDAVRTFDGASVVVLDGSGSTPDVPHGRYIAYHDERVWIYHVSSARSAVYFSSLTDASANIIPPDDASAWDTSDNFLQVSEGDADFGTGMILYNGYLHFFKQYSIWRLVGYDEYTYTRVKTRASTGTRFNESVQILDSVVHLIGVDGIYIFDGDTTVRISDIIDPATASQTAFGFNQIQQPNTNSKFWEVTDTSDWNTGTVPTDMVVANQIALQAADDSQADFQAGVTQTNVDLVSDPGLLEMALSGSGSSTPNIAPNGTPSFGNFIGAAQVGSASFINDGDSNNAVGVNFSVSGGLGEFIITFSRSYQVSVLTLKLLTANSDIVLHFFDNNGTVHTPVSCPVGGQNGTGWEVLGADISANARDVPFTFVPFSTTKIVVDIVGTGGRIAKFTDMQIQQSAYSSSGKFTSKSLDLGATPASVGSFNAAETLNGQSTSYFTQSSDDGISWDAETSVTNGSAVSSTPRRFLRWGVNFSSNGANTPQIDAVYLIGVYISAIHSTGGSIFAWGPFESDYSLLGQTINFYYRTATTSGGVSGASWNFIVPGGVLSTDVGQQFVQFKIEILSGLASNLPIVNSVTINWVVGNGIQPQTLQNVASAYWRNRYWLSAAGPSATSNDTILVRGKKTFESPWMLKDWPILSFTRFQDSLYGGSSVDGSIYQLDSGYSKAGSAIDSYFETGDFVFGGFTATFVEIDIEVERIGSWSLAVGWSVDGGNTWVEKLIDLSVSTFDSNFIKRIQNINVTTTRIRFRFRTNGVDTPFQVHRCIAYYKLEVERGSIRGDYMAANG